MKLLAAGIALLLLSSAGAEAGLFSSSKPKLPKPIDHPGIRPKVRDDHKAGKRAGRHPEQFARPDWGANWDQTLNLKRYHPVPEYLKQSE